MNPIGHRLLSAAVALAVFSLLGSKSFAADPPVPSGPHPRLFMTAANVARFATMAKTSGTASANLLAQCEDTFAEPSYFVDRHGSDALTWPEAAVACAFSYVVTQDPKYLTPALLYWKTSLNDDQKMGDGLGCTTANDKPDWKSWTTGPPPAGILTLTHDTGYPMRWYGPFIALTYDWLYSAPGVDENLLTQTRACLTGWLDYYTAKGYVTDVPGSNYNAGYVLAKTLGAVALGKDGGSDGHLWTETLHEVFDTMLVGNGLKGMNDGLGTPVGILVGGDWGSWEYGPLAIISYAVAARVVEENGAPQPEMDAWVNSLIIRQIHGTVPKRDGQFMGNGDWDDLSTPQVPLSFHQPGAVLAGPSSDQAASWALTTRQPLTVTNSDTAFFSDALAEIRDVTAKDYTAASPAPTLWYLARGAGTLYARTSWDASAYWSVFSSPPAQLDHGHFATSNFVFSRGGDHLIVDPSLYGEYSTWATNALSADSKEGATAEYADYAHTQSHFDLKSLVWLRGTNDAVYAARSDISKLFGIREASDITYAHREWVFLPEGEIVTVDRVHTSAASNNAYVKFHANTGGTLKLDKQTLVATGQVGTTTLKIHPVLVSGGTPKIVQPTVGGCTLNCNYPCGSCDTAQYAVDEYAVTVPGPWAVAIHVIDGLGAGENAEVGSLNDDTFDPAPKQNAGVIGAAVYRGSKQSYVVASSGQDGAAGDSLTYGVLGSSSGRHIVYDAPEASDGTSSVTAAAQSGRCVLTIAAGSGGGIVGHPLMFQVAAASAGCTVSASTDVAPSTPPPGGGVTPIGSSNADAGSSPTPSDTDAGSSPIPPTTVSSHSGGCCAIVSGADKRRGWSGVLIAIAGMVVAHRRWRRSSQRSKSSGEQREM